MLSSFSRSRSFPWFLAVVCTAVLLVSNGLTATALSVYDESILREFGWSRGELKFRDLIGFWLIAAFAPVGGLLCASTLTCIIQISNWFDARRGLAIGIALVGTSLGSIVLSPVNAVLIGRYGWRQTFLIEAALPLVLMALVLLVVKNSPREVGTTAVGVDTGSGRDLRLEGLTLREALGTRTFWAIGISGMLTYYSILALYSHLFLHLRGLGFDPVEAGFALSLLGLCALSGKLLNGALADRFDRRLVFVGSLLVMPAGLAGLVTLRLDVLLGTLVRNEVKS